METLKSGAYIGCPFKSLPTGYMVWAVENDKFKKQWNEIHIELSRRFAYYKMRMQPEPKWDSGCENESWYQHWDLPVQLRYISMITEGAWHWDNIQHKHKDAMDRLNVVLAKLAELFPENVKDTTFEELFDDNGLGPGETEDDITLEEANDILFERLKKNKSTNQQVDDILHMLRTRNASKAKELTYQSVLNRLENVTKLIDEQQSHFDLWEMRDIEWHLESITNRIYWLLRQRDDSME